MNNPIYVISDLHIGSGGLRDSFSQLNRSTIFDKFLDYVEKESGELIILGDFIDLWRFSLKKVVNTRRDLLDRLAEMNVCCIPGNHDQAFTRFINSENLPHPFFRKIKRPFERIIADIKFNFMHGHELDPMNRNLSPSIGRLLGLSSSLLEYAQGRPIFSSDVIEETLYNIEERLFLFGHNFISLFISLAGLDNSVVQTSRRLVPRQKRMVKLLSKFESQKEIAGNDVTISAHTHRLCRFQDWYFNSGSWTGKTNNFIRILPHGKVNLFDWENDIPRPNDTVVSVSSLYPQFKSGYAMAN